MDVSVDGDRCFRQIVLILWSSSTSEGKVSRRATMRVQEICTGRGGRSRWHEREYHQRRCLLVVKVVIGRNQALGLHMLASGAAHS